jgi:hypothetical protein
MKKKALRKLSLRPESIRILTVRQKDLIAGGFISGDCGTGTCYGCGSNDACTVGATRCNPGTGCD